MEYIETFSAFYREWDWLLYTVIYIGALFTIVLENRNPNKSLAYLLLLIFLPVVGLVVFYFFGRDLRKRKRFKLKKKEDREILEQHWKALQNEHCRQMEELETEYAGLTEPARMLFNRREAVPFAGNGVRLLLNGEEKFPELFEALKEARHHIHIEYYTLTEDDVGRQLCDILTGKAREGVEVRVIADGVGSSKIGGLPQRLREAGASYYTFMPVRFASLASANYRNHRKIAIIDGKTGFVGGINLDDRYWNNGKHQLYWRDTSIKLEGPVVNNLQLQFLMSWQFVSKDESFPMEAPYFGAAEARSDGSTVTVVASGPDSQRPHAMDCLVSAIHEARERVRIVNPYFIPDDPVKAAMEIAATSGIEVEIILPGISDSWVVNHASMSYVKPLLQNNVRVYLYEKGFIHAKTITVDGKFAMVGTVNMDMRSFFINFEVAALLYDENLSRQLDESFDADLKACRKLEWESWKERPFWERGVDSACRLLTPLL